MSTLESSVVLIRLTWQPLYVEEKRVACGEHGGVAWGYEGKSRLGGRKASGSGGFVEIADVIDGLR